MRITMILHSLCLMIIFSLKMVYANPPISDPRIIVIDPGHGGDNLGAKHPSHIGKYEKDFTLLIAKLLEEKLISKGHQVFMTRQSDRMVSLQERVQFANEKNADLMLSIHLNSSKNPGPKGHEFYALSEDHIDDSTIRLQIFLENQPQILKSIMTQAPQNQEEEKAIAAVLTLKHNVAVKQSENLAQSLSNAFLELKNIPSKGVKKKDFTVLMGALMPVVVCEVGFINHPKEGIYITSSQGMDKIANQIKNGVETFLKTLP
jgi:N-acetylmuramoyl-L-alanine amidase